METGIFQFRLGNKLIDDPQHRKEIREKLNLDTKKMATLLGIGEAALNRVENERIILSVHLKRIYSRLSHLFRENSLLKAVYQAQEQQMTPDEFIGLLYRETESFHQPSSGKPLF